MTEHIQTKRQPKDTTTDTRDKLLSVRDLKVYFDIFPKGGHAVDQAT